MASEHGIGLSFSARTRLKNVIRLIPAVVIIAATLNTLSCSNPGGFLSAGANSNVSPTSTATASTGALAFVTNFNDGKVSSFTRNTTTGALKHTGQVTAGAKKGPRGVVASPSGSFLYVANINDSNIYEFSVNQTNGTLTPLSPASVSNGNASQPDELAINSSGTLLWVTGAAGTVTSYTVNSSTGQITQSSTIGGFNTPFGITLHPTLSVLYVSDTVTGLIQPMTYNTSTGVLSKSLPAVHSSDPGANTPAAIAIYSPGGGVAGALFTADQSNGEVSSFSINDIAATCSPTCGALTAVSVSDNIATSAAPVGVGIAINTSIEYLLTANHGGNSVSSFVVSSGTQVNTPPALASPYNGPIGLVVDPQNAFVYTADNSDGTIGQSSIKGACGSQICAGPTVPAENPPKANSGPFGITLAQ